MIRTLTPLMFLTAQAFGGLVITGKLSQDGKHSPLVQSYQGKNARLEFHSAPKTAEMMLVYRGETGLMDLIDTQKKIYLEIHEKDLMGIGTLVSNFGKKPQSVEKPLTAAEVTLQKDKGTHRVGDWSCTRYSVLARGKKSGRICVIPMEKVGAKVGDMKPLANIAKSFASLGKMIPQQTTFLGLGMEKALNLGLTVEAVGFDPQGKEIAKMVVETVKTQELAAVTFDAPKDYARNDLSSLVQNLIAGKPVF